MPQVVTVSKAWCLVCGREAYRAVPSLDPRRVLVLCADVGPQPPAYRGCGMVPGTLDPAGVAIVSARKTYQSHLRRHGRKQLPDDRCPTCAELYDKWLAVRV